MTNRPFKLGEFLFTRHHGQMGREKGVVDIGEEQVVVVVVAAAVNVLRI